MALPTASNIRTPDDAGNLGKRVRTHTRVVGSDTVHTHYMWNEETIPYTFSGNYQFHSGTLSVQASAQNGTTTGFLWLFMPIGASLKCGIHRAKVQTTITTNLSAPTAPRLVTQRFTYTGTPSGAAISPCKSRSTYPAAACSVRTASTGMSVTLEQIARSTLPPVTAGTAGWTFAIPYRDELAANSHSAHADELAFAAGEGLVFYQPDAGTAADTRKAQMDWEISEFEE